MKRTSKILDLIEIERLNRNSNNSFSYRKIGTFGRISSFSAVSKFGQIVLEICSGCDESKVRPIIEKMAMEISKVRGVKNYSIHVILRS